MLDSQTQKRIRGQLEKDCPAFWERFGSTPDFADKSILEIGCGLGALCIDMSKRGARHVTGIDVLESDVDTAQKFAEAEFPDNAKRITYTSESIDAIDGPFDLIVSKDAFEHILDPGAMLARIRAMLASNGRAVIGFSPLYHSPFGDHDRRKAAFRTSGLLGRIVPLLPWGHVFFEKQVLKRHPLTVNKTGKSMHDLFLNKMTIGEFRQFIQEASLTTELEYINIGGGVIGRVLSLLRHVPGLETYCTYNVYCILKPSDN